MTDEQARPATRAGAPVGQFTLEAMTWVSRLVGGPGWGTVRVLEAVYPGDTIRKGLKRLSERYPELRAVLWTRDTGELTDHLHIMVNERALGVERGLDSPLADGDTITLLGQFSGGS